jgi:hypothetical protein
MGGWGGWINLMDFYVNFEDVESFDAENLQFSRLEFKKLYKL